MKNWHQLVVVSHNHMRSTNGGAIHGRAIHVGCPSAHRSHWRGNIRCRCWHIQINMLRLRRFLLECNKLVLIVLKVFFAEADRLTILLLLMSSTMPNTTKLDLFLTKKSTEEKRLTEQGYQSERKPCCTENRHKAVPECAYAHASSSALIS